MANVSSSNGLEKRPKLRFPGFDEPWCSHKFSSVFSFLQNNTLSRAELDATGDVLDIHYGDVLIKYGSILNATDNTIPHIISGHESTNYDYLQDGDIIVADTAEDETVGKTIELLNISGRKIEAGLHTVPCRPLFPFASMYLGYYMNTPHYHKQLVPLMQGIKVLSISKGNISKTEISSPQTIAEQEKISRFLYLLDQRAAAQSKIIDALKKYKRGLQNRFFFKRSHLSPKASEIDSHDVEPLGSVVHINPKTGSLPEAFIYIDLECVESGVLNSKKLISRNSAPSRAQRLLEEGDLLYQMVRPYQKNNYYFQKGFEYPTVASTGYAQIRCSEMDTQFIYEQLSSDYFAREAMLRSTGTGYPAINADDLAEIPIWVPPLNQQEKIGAALSSLGEKIEVHQKLLSALCSVKFSLLQQLFI